MNNNTKKETKTSKFPGVSFDPDLKRWRAVFDHKTIGRFETKDEASLAVCKAMVDKAQAEDEKERLRDPAAYFFRDPVDKPWQWSEAEIRDLAMGENDADD
jgi:hypothetical protein